PAAGTALHDIGRRQGLDGKGRDQFRDPHVRATAPHDRHAMNVLRSFRLRVHHREISGAPVTEPDDTTVDFTIGLGDMEEPPTLPGPIVRPFEGKVETRPWRFKVIDTDGL